MASIRRNRTKPDRWEIRYTGPDGTRISKTVTAESRRDAERQALTLETAAGKPGSDLTVTAIVTAWLNRGVRTERSHAEIERRLRLHIGPNLGHLRAEDVTTELLERSYADLRKNGLSAGTVRHVHWDLSGSYKLARRNGQVAENPCELVELEELTRRTRIPPDPADVARFFQVCIADDATWPAREAGLVVLIAASCGLRLGEVCALRWADIDRDRGVIHVRGSVTILPGGRGPALKSTKTGRERSVPLPAALADVLAEHHDRAAKELGGIDPKPGWYVLFGTHPGTSPCSPNRIKGRVQRAHAQAGTQFEIHALRHLAITAWVDAGVPMHQAAQLAGHARPSTTSDIYAHARPEIDQRAHATAAATAAAVTARPAGATNPVAPAGLPLFGKEGGEAG